MPRRPSAVKRPAAVIFDLDGTLVDTVGTRIRAWMRTFDEAGLAVGKDHLSGLIGADGRWLAREVAGAAGMALAEDRAEEIDRRSGEIYGELNTNPRALRGARDVLGALDERGIPWAIATSSRREQVAASVAALDLAHEPRVVDGSHVAHAKPEPDLLLLAAAELGTAADGCWYVGDSAWDMRASVAARMLPVAVLAGAVATADSLRAAGAQIVLATLDELLPMLG